MPGANELSTVDTASAHWMPILILPFSSKSREMPTTASSPGSSVTAGRQDHPAARQIAQHLAQRIHIHLRPARAPPWVKRRARPAIRPPRERDVADAVTPEGFIAKSGITKGVAAFANLLHGAFPPEIVRKTVARAQIEESVPRPRT
jgi:hypothetical protein